MNNLIYKKAKKVWNEIGQNKNPGEVQVEIDIYKKMLNIFQVGEYCYFIFCPTEMRMDYTNESITNLTGYSPEEFTLELFLENIHPDDLQTYLSFEATITEFWKKLPVKKVMKYKTRYDFRMSCKNKEYKRLLQQVIPIQSDEDGAVLRTFVVFTDISHLKQSNKMVLSMIGLEGEPSYIDVEPVDEFIPYKGIFTKREKEVFDLLVQNRTSKQIAEELYVSVPTVSSHRKNIFKKTGVSSVSELILLGLEKGWI